MEGEDHDSWWRKSEHAPLVLVSGDGDKGKRRGAKRYWAEEKMGSGQEEKEEGGRWV
jgi:hypothetical protein